MFRSCVLFACSGAALGDVHINFDELAAGTQLATHYTASYGITMSGLGDGGPFDVISDMPCNGGLSQPHVLSLSPLEVCPETNDVRGYFEVSFASEQSFVQIRTLHSLSGTVSYLMAFSGPGDGDFLNQTFGNFDLVGVPQTLRIDRQPQERKIRRVRFGVFNLDQRVASFDDLSFEQGTVAAQGRSWSAVKARW